MKINAYLKTTLFLSIGGTLFAGYLSAVKIFEEVCAFNETCPYFLGYPACYFGFVLFALLLASSVAAYFHKGYKNLVVKINTAVSGLGVLFSVYISAIDLIDFFGREGASYALLLPTCVYGAVFFIIVFALSAMSLKK